MSQRQLAEKLGIHPTLVSRRLRGGKDRSWTLAEMEQIARILDVSVEQLISPRLALAVAA